MTPCLSTASKLARSWASQRRHSPVSAVRAGSRTCASGGGDPLYRSAELRTYRAKSKCRGASSKSVTNAIPEPSKSAPEARTQPAQIVPHARNDLGLERYPPPLRGLWEAISASPFRCTLVLAGVSEASGPRTSWAQERGMTRPRSAWDSLADSFGEPLPWPPRPAPEPAAPEPAGPQRGPRKVPSGRRVSAC